MIQFSQPTTSAIKAPEALSFIIYTLFAVLKKGGATDGDIEYMTKMCAKHINDLPTEEKQIIEQVIKAKFNDIPTPGIETITNDSTMKGKDFI